MAGMRASPGNALEDLVTEKFGRLSRNGGIGGGGGGSSARRSIVDNKGVADYSATGHASSIDATIILDGRACTFGAPRDSGRFGSSSGSPEKAGSHSSHADARELHRFAAPKPKPSKGGTARSLALAVSAEHSFSEDDPAPRSIWEPTRADPSRRTPNSPLDRLVSMKFGEKSSSQGQGLNLSQCFNRAADRDRGNGAYSSSEESWAPPQHGAHPQAHPLHPQQPQRLYSRYNAPEPQHAPQRKDHTSAALRTSGGLARSQTKLSHSHSEFH
jgi:hypothetical protein